MDNKSKYKKSILFLSAIDFKERSIQVISKTPEAYRDSGWGVTYIVCRDNCATGNYFYEKEINLKNISIIRSYWPLPILRSKLSRLPSLLLNKFCSIIVVFKLLLFSLKEINNNHFDVIYGYELQGVLAVKILKFFRLTRNAKIVSRFQGSFLYEMLNKKQYTRLIFNFDSILALKSKSDLIIMTDDGTQGNKALKLLRRQNDSNIRFWVNGVDKFIPNAKKIAHIKKVYDLTGKFVFISVSRLVSWKRIERCLLLIKTLKSTGIKNFKYLIVGDGNQKSYLMDLTKELKIQDTVIFIGSVPNQQIKDYMCIADIFLSMYDSSNVGNPLLEAMRLNKIIVTLDNGDTGKWIKHKKNGLIYSEKNIDYKLISQDVTNLINSKEFFNNLLHETRVSAQERLWTWKERMDAEVYAVDQLAFSHTKSLGRFTVDTEQNRF